MCFFADFKLCQKIDWLSLLAKIKPGKLIGFGSKLGSEIDWIWLLAKIKLCYNLNFVRIDWNWLLAKIKVCYCVNLVEFHSLPSSLLQHNSPIINSNNCIFNLPSVLGSERTCDVIAISARRIAFCDCLCSLPATAAHHHHHHHHDNNNNNRLRITVPPTSRALDTEHQYYFFTKLQTATWPDSMNIAAQRNRLPPPTGIPWYQEQQEPEQRRESRQQQLHRKVRSRKSRRREMMRIRRRRLHSAGWTARAHRLRYQYRRLQRTIKISSRSIGELRRSSLRASHRRNVAGQHIKIRSRTTTLRLPRTRTKTMTTRIPTSTLHLILPVSVTCTHTSSHLHISISIPSLPGASPTALRFLFLRHLCRASRYAQESITLAADVARAPEGLNSFCVPFSTDVFQSRARCFSPWPLPKIMRNNRRPTNSIPLPSRMRPPQIRLTATATLSAQSRLLVSAYPHPHPHPLPD